MSWARIDDRANEHRKSLAAGAEAMWLWTCGLMYANRQDARDGFIPEPMIAMLYPFRSPKRLANKLVEAGLWERVDGGYRVHDYEQWNPSKAQVDAEKAKGRERAAASYERRRERTARQSSPEEPAKSSPEEQPKMPAEESRTLHDSSGSTPLHSNDPPVVPQGDTTPALTVQEQAQRYLRDPAAAQLEFGAPEHWPPLVELRRRASEHFRGMGAVPRGGATNAAVRNPIARLADGFTVDDLVRVVAGAAADEHVQRHPKLQHLGWLCEEPDRVERFLQVAAAPQALATPQDRQAERARRATQRAKAESAIRAAYLRRKEPPAEATKLFTAEELGRMREEEDLRRESMRRAAE